MQTITEIKPTTLPPTTEEREQLKIRDYAEPLTEIAEQMRVLEHALPVADVTKIENSFRILRSSMVDLRLFLLLRGFDV